MKNKSLFKFILSALFIALGLVLPFFTAQLQSLGSMLLPMHIPVVLCGLICGRKFGFGVGFALPLLRSLIFSMPVLYPNAAAMAFELAAYGFVAGFIFEKSKNKSIRALYLAIASGMLFSRLVWGAAMAALLSAGVDTFTFSAFISGAFINSVPGTALQLICVPAIMVALKKTNLIYYKKEV